MSNTCIYHTSCGVEDCPPAPKKTLATYPWNTYYRQQDLPHKPTKMPVNGHACMIDHEPITYLFSILLSTK